MIPEYDRKRIRQAVLAAIEPSQPDLADRVVAATQGEGVRQRDARPPLMLSAAAVLLTVSLVALLVFGTRLGPRQSHEASFGRPSPILSQGPAGPALGLPADRLSWVHFTSPSTGWAAQPSGTSQPGQNPQTTVYATSDGGVHWIARLTYQGYPPGQINLDPDGEGIIVASALLGQGEGGTPTYFRTTDRGVHWQPMPYPADVRAWGSAYFKDAREGWVTAYPAGTIMVASVYHTTDGAQTWSQSKVFDVQQAFGRSGGLQGQIAFRNADQGVIVGPTMSGTGIPITAPHLWATRDGGVSWRQVDLVVPAGEKLDSSNTMMVATMLPDGTCIVLAQGRPMLSSQAGNPSPLPPSPVYAYRSTDGGLTFSVAIRLPDQAIGRPYLLDARHWWVGAGGSSLMVTADAGRSWETHAQVLPAGLTFTSIEFTSPKDGWAVASRRGSAGQLYLFQTHDGGAHWSGFAPPNPVPR